MNTQKWKKMIQLQYKLYRLPQLNISISCYSYKIRINYSTVAIRTTGQTRLYNRKQKCQAIPFPYLMCLTCNKFTFHSLLISNVVDQLRVACSNLWDLLIMQLQLQLSVRRHRRTWSVTVIYCIVITRTSKINTTRKRSLLLAIVVFKYLL